MFLFLGNIQLGVSSIMTGPIGSEEDLGNTLNEHAVVRGKPVPQDGGEELDRRSFSFFFDETFCDPQRQYALLLMARSTREVLPLVMGNGTYLGKRYAVQGVNITHLKTTEGGALVRLEAGIDLLEVPSGALSIGGVGIAALGRALINPLIRRL
jgi:hypothetical protein